MKLHVLCILAATSTLALAKTQEPRTHTSVHPGKKVKVAGTTRPAGTRAQNGVKATSTGAQTGVGAPVATIPESGSALFGLGVLGFCLVSSVRRRMSELPDSTRR